MRTKGAKQKESTSEARIGIRLSESLLQDLDAVAQRQLQNRSEAVLEAIRIYVSNRKV
jgi:metal-responsive CopG/Arc/MetJ family transcriptional regulator